MKVTIEIPKNAIKKAAYLLLSQTKSAEVEETINNAVEICEQSEGIEISDELFDDQKDQIHLVFAVSALAMKVKELEDKA